MVDVSSPPTWTEQARSIHDLVCQARYITTSNGAADLCRQLSVYTPIFLNLLDDEPKSAQDRQLLQSGTAYIGGVERKVDTEFIRETIFLSDQLDINEWVAATLLTCGKNTCSRTGANAIDASVLLYYDEQVYLLAALDVILASIKDDSVNDDIRSVFHQFTLELMGTKVDTKGTSSTGSFVSKLLQANNDLRKQIGTVIESGGMVINNGIISNSNNGATTTSATGGILGEDIIAKRLDRMKDERIYIVQIVYHLASLTRLSQDDIFDILELLQLSDLTDVTTPYLMVALLSTISPHESDEDEMTGDDSLLSDVNFIDSFYSKLLGNLFKVPAIKAVVALQWCLFATRARNRYEQVAEFSKVSEQVIEQLTYGAIETKAFQFLNDYILYFQHTNAKLDTNRQLLKKSVIEEMQDTMYDIAIDPTDFTKFNADIRQDFHPFVLFELEKLALGIIENMGEILQKIRYRDEDNASPLRSPPSPQSNNMALDDNDNDDCNGNGQYKDTEHFFVLLTNIYRDRRNKGAIFWVPDNNYLYSFIQRSTDIRVPSTVGACYDFFGSISTGDQCATLAYDFLNTDHTTSSSLISWGKLFATLQYYGPLLRDAAGEISPVLHPAEERCLIKFLYLLQQVVLYSVKARSEMWVDSKLNVLDSIMEVLKYTNSTALRASLYDTLGAFCTSWGGGINQIGATISRQVWEVLERSGEFVVKKNRAQTGNYDISNEPTIMKHLEKERGLLVYPQTLSVLRLFGSAIHTQSKRDELISGFKPIASTLPLGLGKESRGYNAPGGQPYISLVINGIFLRLPGLQYKYPGEKWQLSAAALRVLENSLLSFDLQELEEMTANRNKKAKQALCRVVVKKIIGETESMQLQKLLLHYTAHPGYNVMIEILSGGPFCKQLLKIIEYGVDGVTNKREYGQFFIECIVRSLRIVYRVLQLQSSFCNLLVPHLSDFKNRSGTTGIMLNNFEFDTLPSLESLGRHLLCQANAIVQIAMLMNCEDHEEICYLSTKILDALSAESKYDNAIIKGFGFVGAYTPMAGMGSRLAIVLDACKDAPSIVYGVGERLEIEQPETITYDDYPYDINNIPFWLAVKTLEDTYNYDTDLSWLHRTSSVRIAILDLLLENATVDQPSPTLTEFLLGYTTCNKFDNDIIQRQGSDSLSIVFESVLKMIQTHDSGDGMDIVEETNHSTCLIETHPILAEKCYQLVYRLVAKQSTSIKTLRHLRNEEEFFVKQFKALSARLGTLAVTESPVFDGAMVCPDGSVIQTDFFRLLSMLHQRAWLLKSLALELHYSAGMQQKSQVEKLLNLLFGQQVDATMGAFEQDLVKILEIASSLEFRWDDGMVTKTDFTPPIVFFADFSANDYQILNERQCMIYDIRTIYSKLHELKSQLHITSNDERVAVEYEMKNILQSLVVENHVREIVHGRVHCLRAWKQVVQVAVTECFDYFPSENRQSIIYALMMAILPKMLPGEGFDSEILKALSELVCTLMIQLRGKNQAALTLDTVSTSYGLPDGKVVQLFVGILDTIQETSTTIQVRGDMYTALVNLLQYIQQHHPQISNSTKVEKQLVKLLSNRYESVLDTICNDSCDGFGIWRTTAFTALNALYILTDHVDDTIFLSLLVKRNFLRYSVDMIRNDDSAMLKILSEVDEPLLPMYIYQAKISLFMNVASKIKGAQLLLESGVLDVLGHCEFIGKRPKPSDNTDTDKTLMERYDQVLLPTLRLIITLLYNVGRANDSLLEMVEGWVAKQQEALAYILQCNNNNVTMSFLQELKFVVTIMYYLSCRPGYFENMYRINLNHLHVLLVKLNQQGISNKLVLDEESISSTQWVSGSIVVNDAKKMVHTIQDYIQAYEHNANI
ncbi:nucleoporin Nup186/Nup192/Nup205 [Chlamydoabsidia padenii]|nr:nucleoporin Nup186/Nup192/Nup205 [Chlamydoabsidia padenii]